ncbi:MAG: leucine-rich repeat domain-containing protein [Ruminococcaceae bacterium]|nr:leucine-rich repeat domain-containing protein [Oscillospiraceae bacterium]
MKKSLLIKILMMALAMVLVFALASCDIEEDDGYQDKEDLQDINKDLEDAKPSEGLKFKKGVDKDGTEYYSVTGRGDCKDAIIIIPAEHEGIPVTKIGGNAFSESQYDEEDGIPRLERVLIPESVTSIAHHAFAECESLQSIKLPDSLITLDSNAFEGCEKANALYIGNKVQKIAKAAFAGCKNIQVVYLPDTLTEMSAGVFQDCKMLGKVDFGNGIDFIPDATFYNCVTLQELDLPNNLVKIGADAFRGCESLMSFDIPDTVTSVGDRAFMRCMALEKITIPVSVETWGNFVTYFCKNLSSFVYEGTRAQYEAIKCYPPLSYEEDGSPKVVTPNQSLSMYLSIKATHVECTDGTFDIKQIMEDNGFMDSENLNPDAGKTEEKDEEAAE